MSYNEKYPSRLLQDAVDAIGTLPGVGRRSALKLAWGADSPFEPLRAANGLQDPDKQPVEISIVTPAIFCWREDFSFYGKMHIACREGIFMETGRYKETARRHQPRRRRQRDH